MAVSTVSQTGEGGRGIPSTRLVLLKKVDSGFVFYTNYESRKGQELGLSAAQIDSTGKGNYASMAFYFREQHRSVRVVGRSERISATETEEYFNGRPIGSRIGAWSSPQSTVLSDRDELEGLVGKTEAKFDIQKDAEGNEIEKVSSMLTLSSITLIPFDRQFQYQSSGEE